MYFVRCCSDEESFHCERRYLKLIYLFYGFSVHFVDYSVEEFFKEFSISTTYYSMDRIPYDQLRQHAIEYYRCLKKLQKQSIKLMDNIQTLSYSSYWSSFTINPLKQCITNLCTTCYAYQPNFYENDTQIGLSLTLKQIPSHIVEYLMKEKPPRYILTLSK